MSADAALEAVVERARGLATDMEFDAVARWKAVEEGRRAVGFLPVTVPREILHAAGVLPVGIIGGGDQVEIIRGDAYFQSYICHIPRSVVELGVSGKLDCLDGIIFPSTCDVIRNLCGVWQLLFPDRFVRYLDMPQNFDHAMGGAWYAAELTSLRNEMGALAGRAVSDDHLKASIAAYNELRARMRRLQEMRRAEPWRVPASEVQLLFRAGLVVPVEEFGTLLDDYMESVARVDRRSYDNVRVVLVGAFCEQPPIDLIKTLERAGCYVVDDDCLLVHTWPDQDVPMRGDPVSSLVDAYLSNERDQACRFAPDGVEKGKWLVDRVRALDADGVVFAAASFCDPALLDRPMQQAALAEANIPSTAFKYSENTGQFQPIREQTGTFADSIKLWSVA